ncbi:hypothetical protein EJB05_36674, partial [Eragrostis curvula]
MEGLSNLDFQPGLQFQQLVRDRFGHSFTVSSPSPVNEFFLVASFGRSAIRINEESVGLILQSCLGGVAKDFRVQLQKDWCFRFSVSCKSVGFLIYHLKSVLCKSFALFFALWGNGGPNWMRQKQIWECIQDEEWHVVCHSKRSYASVVRSTGPNKSSAKGKAPAAISSGSSLKNKEVADYQMPKNSNVLPRGFSQQLSNMAGIHKPSIFKRIRYPDNYYESNYAKEISGDRVHRMEAPRQQVSNSNLNGCHQQQLRDSRPVSCFRCLSPLHLIANCNNSVRCKICYFYGHISRDCRAKFRFRASAWAKKDPVDHGPAGNPKPIGNGEASISGDSGQSPPSPPPNQNSSACSSPLAGNSAPPSSAAMANFPVDPRHFTEPGFTIAPKDPARPPIRIRSYLGRAPEKSFEDTAIAILEPRVAQLDFRHMARALRGYLVSEFQLCDTMIYPCPMGAAYVRFCTPLQRQAMINNGPRNFGAYTLTFVPHDAGINRRAVDVVRDVWLQLLCFPLDARSFSAVAKAVSSFGLLKEMHDASYAAVIAHVVLRDDAVVPDEITVTLGEEPSMRSWAVPVDILHVANVEIPGDEDGLPVDGPLHPRPPPAAPWVGPHYDFDGDESHVEDAPDSGVNQMGSDQQAPMDMNVRSGDAYDSGGEGQNLSGAAADFAASGGDLIAQSERDINVPVQSHNTDLADEKRLAVEENTEVEAPENQNMSLAVVPATNMNSPPPGPSNPVPKKVVKRASKEALIEAMEDSEQEEDEEVVELSKKEAMAATKRTTPKKKKMKKMREECKDTRFLRRSGRLNDSLQGFKDASSAAAAAEGPSELHQYIGRFDRDAGAAPPPHLSVENAQAIAAGFLKMQLTAVSDAALLASDDVNEE